jgi:hypothetical protein
MARCPAHGNRIQQTPLGAANLFGANPQPDCRQTAWCDTPALMLASVPLKLPSSPLLLSLL